MKNTETPAGSLLFEASISPNQSLSRPGRIKLLIGLTVGCALMGARAIWIGAWPVAAFGTVELGLAAFLFWLHARSQRQTELVLLFQNAFRLVRVSFDGRRQQTTLPLRWLAVELEERAGRVPGLYVRCRDDRMALHRHEIARMLGDAEKRELATLLREAVHQLVHPEFDNWQLRVGANRESEQDRSAPSI